MNDTGPATYRLLLGRELRELRAAADVSRDAAAREVGWHLSKLSKVEQGQATVKSTEITALLGLYNASPEDSERVRELGTHARKRGNFGKVADWARQYLAFEADARAVYAYDTELVHGLFQTRAYADAIVSTSAVVAAVDVPRVVDARIRRKALFERQPAPAVHLVLGEAALRRQVGGPAVLAEQLRYLLELADQQNVTIQVLDFAAGQHAALGSGFTLLDLEVGAITKTWVYLEDLTRADLLDGASHVHAYRLAFSNLAERTALSPHESIIKLKAVADDLER
jgi:transcriptional regulator with XRE-family HTH domain